jgi:DNA-directed RNA polymerase specialized sigma24 family protein
MTHTAPKRRRKEAYVGAWLPEPLLTAPDVAEDVELADSVSMALMLVLEMLSPTERAVFVLREAFDLGYDEIAAAVGKSPAAVRQIAHRARQHVEARTPTPWNAPTAIACSTATSTTPSTTWPTRGSWPRPADACGTCPTS